MRAPFASHMDKPVCALGADALLLSTITKTTKTI